MIINHNMNAMNAGRNMNMNIGRAGKSMEKLSSGLRINRAGDDAAGLAISEKMRGQIRGLDQASRNAQDGISLIQTAEGALNETHSILQRMRELSVQSANDTNNDNDRTEIQKEITQLTEEIDRISTDTEFNTKKLLTGNLGSKASNDVTKSTALAPANKLTGVQGSEVEVGTYAVATTAGGDVTVTFGGNTQTIAASAGEQTLDFSDFGIKITTDSTFAAPTAVATLGNIEVEAGSANFQIGANEEQNIGVAISDMSSTGLGVNGLDVSTQAGADTAITTVQTAIDSVSSERAKLGAYQNRLEHTINNLNTSSENLQASESRIRDVDMAKEMMNFSKENILQQAAQSMLAQAKQAPQGVLQLLR